VIDPLVTDCRANPIPAHSTGPPTSRLATIVRPNASSGLHISYTATADGAEGVVVEAAQESSA